MTAPQTPERPARDGETCSCGRPAVTVSQTEKVGDVPFCGVEGGGHSAPQTPPSAVVSGPLWRRDGDYPKLAVELLELTSDQVYVNVSVSDEQVPTALGALRLIRDTDDPDKLDAALRALIRHAQAARKILKAGAS
jgi:hypothetical protein